MTVRHIEILRPIQPETIQPSRGNQIFQRLLVHRLVIQSLEEIEKILVPPVSISFPDNRMHGSLSNPLDSGHPETNISLVVHREIIIRLVHIRSQHAQPHSLTLVHENRNLLNL